jgi:gamma-glutamylcyclotransferase (GGCT)/AIG2-like uncharacterized protein YtfP
VSNLFAYGTLMCEDIMTALIGRRLPAKAATLWDYRRYAVRRADYPGVVACAGASVRGLLYRNLTAMCWHHLDRFEGEMYARRPVSVALDHDENEAAETYVIKPAYLHQLEAIDWDFEAFLKRFNGRTAPKSRVRSRP